MVTKKVKKGYEKPDWFNANKRLQNFWVKLSAGIIFVFIYKEKNKYKIKKIPNWNKRKTKAYEKSRKKMIEDAENDSTIKAILTSGQSWEGYENLFKLVEKSKAKGKKLEYIFHNYKKYFKIIGEGKFRYC